MSKWIFGVLLAGLQIHAAALFTENFEAGALDKKWQPVKFEGSTAYTVVADETKTNHVLQATAKSSASGLGAQVDFPLKSKTTFSWRWKLDRTPPGGSEDKKQTFDHTVRIFVAFKTLIGPPRTINYVWANNLAAGKTFNHPSSNRARFIVLQSGDAKARQWQKESRDLLADWHMLFGKEEPPQIVSIGLMTDSDGTASEVTGWYDDLQIVSE